MDKHLVSTKAKLLSNKIYFDSSVKIAERLFKEDLIEDCINYIEKTASFAWHNFSGTYKSALLEEILNKIQKKILIPVERKKKNKSTRKILHICSEIDTSGGHSKLLYNWIKLDKNREHTILSTRFSEDKIIDISKNYTADFSNLKHHSVLAETKTKSVILLNSFITNEYDLIVLHTHPDEVIANIVLSQPNIAIPVCFVNHADHTFWLGTYISDLILQIRKSNLVSDVLKRGIPIEKQFFLPIPIDVKSNENVRDNSKEKNYTYLLSTGTAFKYHPTENYNFLEEAYKIVVDYDEVIFNIVGIKAESAYAKKYQHDRLILHGQIASAKLREIEKNTDIYVEGFPMPSFTALLQVAMMKIPFILHYKPLPLFRLFDDCKSHEIVYAENLIEWRVSIRKLISDVKFRAVVSEKQQNFIINNFSNEAWLNQLNEIYEKTDKLEHTFLLPSKDVWFYEENEEMLVTIDNRKFSHYRFTYNLSIVGKLFVFAKSITQNVNVGYLEKKDILKYFINNFRA